MPHPSATCSALLFWVLSSLTQAQVPMDRLPRKVLSVTPPSARVEGNPGSLRIVQRGCTAQPMTEIRQRIVNIATQEWAYFGFSVEDPAPMDPQLMRLPIERRWPAFTAAEAERLATSIAGYWAAAPDTDWLLQRQNERWQREGLTARWRDAWSAVFISWVMCEAGIADPSQFQRAIAHHSYIDQAIRAQDGHSDDALFVAHALGEQPLIPGDLLCRGSRPAYRSLDERRRQLGEGARTHCDIVVKVDAQAEEVLTIGGNVRGSVRMKRLPAQRSAKGHWYADNDRGRPLFAHLALRAAPIDATALDHSPTWLALTCEQAPSTLQLAAQAPSLDGGSCG